MAIAFANDGASANPDLYSTSNASSYANSSWTPPTSNLILCFVANSKASTPDAVNSLTGNGITWTNIATIVNSSSVQRITLFGANGSGSSAEATTADFNSVNQTGCGLSFFHATGVDLSGGVLAAFVQAITQAGATGQTSGSVTLGAAGNSDNRPIACFVHGATEATTERANWTEVDDGSWATPARGMQTQWRSDAFETTASATWTTSSLYCAIAAELKATLTGRTTHNTDPRPLGIFAGISRTVNNPKMYRLNANKKLFVPSHLGKIVTPAMLGVAG